MMRAGVCNKTDVGLYVTKNFQANYGFVGAQAAEYDVACVSTLPLKVGIGR